MATVTTLEAIKEFIENNVCNDIKLKKQSDKNVNEFELVNPSVFIMNLPPKGFLPANIETAIPGIIVSFEEGLDDGINAEININLVVAVYNPGLHYIDNEANNELAFIPDGQGWRDLINLLDKTRGKLTSCQILNGVKLNYPIKWGIYKQEQTNDLDPYNYGWITFSVKRLSYPKTEVEKQLL